MTECEALVASMVTRFPDLRPLLDEHTKDNFGEVLPHVFFGDLSRYVLSLFVSATAGVSAKRSELRAILDSLEKAYSGGDRDIQELISASFLENLPRPGETGHNIREMVGPNLRNRLHVIG